MSDLRQRFLFTNANARGELVQLEQTLNDIFSKHEYPDIIRKLLGEFLAAAALLSGSVKFDGSLTLQVKSQGQINMLMAECTNQQDFRAIATFNEPLDDSLPMIGKGQMAITIEPNKGQRYQSIVPITDQALTEELALYFIQSEQLPTQFWLKATPTKCAGMLLQTLPHSASEASIQNENHDWNRLCLLGDTLQEDELLNLPTLDILHRLFHQEQVTYFSEKTLQFACSCSQQRTGRALLALGETDARSLLAEKQGNISIDCQFCNTQYLFDQKGLNDIFKSSVH